MNRTCTHCASPLALNKRAHARYCSQTCADRDRRKRIKCAVWAIELANPQDPGSCIKAIASAQHLLKRE